MIFGKTNNYFSPDAIAKVLKQPELHNATEREHYLILCLLYETGAQASEILNARTEDVFFTEQPCMRLSSPGGSRTIHLPGFLTEMISQHMQEKQLSLTDRLFFHDRTMSSQELCRLLRMYIRKTKIQYPDLIPDFHSIHHFRISRANHLYMAGMDIDDLRQFLGHESTGDTMRYVGILYHPN